MRFRTEVPADAMPHLTTIVETASKLGTELCFRFHKDATVIFSLNSDPKLVCYAQLSTAATFQDFRCESSADGAIACRAHAATVVASMKACVGARAITWRLTSVHGKIVLCMHARGMDSSAALEGTHHIPVQVSPREDVAQWGPPALPAALFTVRLPALDMLRSVVEKHASIARWSGDSIAEPLQLSMWKDQHAAGALQLTAQAPMAALSTTVRGLVCHELQVEEAPGAAPPSALSMDIPGTGHVHASLVPAKELAKAVVSLPASEPTAISLCARQSVLIHQPVETLGSISVLIQTVALPADVS